MQTLPSAAPAFRVPKWCIWAPCMAVLVAVDDVLHPPPSGDSYASSRWHQPLIHLNALSLGALTSTSAPLHQSSAMMRESSTPAVQLSVTGR